MIINEMNKKLVESTGEYFPKKSIKSNFYLLRSGYGFVEKQLNEIYNTVNLIEL